MLNTGSLHIAIAGAGSVGCFVGGVLAENGHHVSFLGRPKTVEVFHENGLRLTDNMGLELRPSISTSDISSDPSILSGADIILVTVKGPATAEMGHLIAAHGKPDALIVSLQNGVRNADVLRDGLPSHTVLAGMVPYNIVNLGGGRFHRGTSGDIKIEKNDPDVASLLSGPGLNVVSVDDMRAVQWGKLLVNLNNALNALSGLPLKEELETRAWRLLLAEMQEEAMAAMQAAGIKAKAATPMPPALMPFILRLPDTLFKLLARRMLNIDAKARSSMWEDLQQNRATEIEDLQGAVVELADRAGLSAPLNERVAVLIRRAAGEGNGAPNLSAQDVKAG